MRFPIRLPSILVVRQTRPHEGTAIRLLLASIIRRAAYDIALYRDDSRLVHRRVGVSAYNWMFEDNLDRLHPDDQFTSFRSICEILDQCPEQLRRKTMLLTRSGVKKFDRVGV